MNIFKIYYDWYEGEHEETLVGKEVEKEQFLTDLIKAKDFAESMTGVKIDWNDKEPYVGRGYVVECLPEYYEQIIWYLTNKLGYIDCCFDEDISYKVDDNYYEEKPHIGLEEKEETIKWTPIDVTLTNDKV